MIEDRTADLGAGAAPEPVSSSSPFAGLGWVGPSLFDAPVGARARAQRAMADESAGPKLVVEADVFGPLGDWFAIAPGWSGRLPSGLLVASVLPGRWLVIGQASDDRARVLDEVARVDPDRRAIDVSEARFVLRVFGPQTFQLLGACCALDVGPRRLEPDRVLTTLVAGARCTLVREDLPAGPGGPETTSVLVIGARSHAWHVATALREAEPLTAVAARGFGAWR